MDYLWLIFALVSAAMAAFVAFFGKIGLQGMDSNSATAIRAIVMAIFLVGLIVVQGKLGEIPKIISDHKAITFIIFSSIAGALSWLFYFLALKLAKVSQVASIDRLSIVFAVVLAMLFLGEKLSIKAGIGVALIAAGAILVAIG
jgi:transporter family protein